MTPLLQLTAVFLLITISGAAAAPPDECPTAFCDFDAFFPFWIEGKQSPSCGLPGFQITCIYHSAHIGISNLSFTVELHPQMGEYEDSLRVIPPDPKLFACLLLQKKSFFNSTPLSLYFRPSPYSTLFFFYNCSRNLDPAKYSRITCGQRNNSYFGWSEENLPEGACQRVSKLPSAAQVTVDRGNLTAILSWGFYMSWEENICSKCQESGGKCRYNVEENRFGCLCANELLLDICPSKPNGNTIPSHDNRRIILVATLTAAFSLVFGLFVALIGYMAWKKCHNHDTKGPVGDGLSFLKNTNASTDKNGELTHFDLSTISLATKKFSRKNKIGAGGFGEVYKGILEDGQSIAVKRISLQSEERVNEFMMEVEVIAKFQHRNLVRLVGCCVEGSERMLVYEFVTNKSLDFFIFGDEEKRKLLDWEKRLSIIMGVARGLLYLHQDSILRVIHRDLKAANILIDEDMNPKISDFGTARIFEREQIDDNTIKIVGTIGYMSPEYIMSGNFSEKSDIFSFGVIILEIISGKRNKWASQKGSCMELLADAWTLCMENQIHKLLDSALNHPTELDTIIKFVKVGLLCVQDDPDDRPTMQGVIRTLVREDEILSKPKRPGFFQPTLFSVQHHSLMFEREITITTLEAR